MEPEQVLDLIRSAPERYDTVRAALRYRGDGRTIKAACDRYLASELGRLEPGVCPAPPWKATTPSSTALSAGAAARGMRA